jgi:hypothetical protein
MHQGDTESVTAWRMDTIGGMWQHGVAGSRASGETR